MKKNLILLTIIVFLGVFIRFYQLGSVPLSLNWDEVSIGYNAYSILHSGKDEYGTTYPLTFRSFGDYKQPVYIYLSTIPIKFLGLNEVSVRFLSSFMGSISVIFVYLLVRELFYKSKNKETFAIFSTGLYAISPWSVQFSRFASEANVGMCLVIGGAFLFLYAIRKNNLFYLLLSAIIFTFSMYTYHSQKVFTPFLVCILFVIHFRYLLKNRVKTLLFIVLFILLNLFWIVDPSSTARGKSVLITSGQTQLLENPIKYGYQDKQSGDVIGAILHNRRAVYLQVFLKNYLSHFDPSFLFLEGDNARHHAPYMGVEYLITLPFIVIGLLHLWRNYRFQAKFLSAWLIVAPITSSLAIDSPNAIRSMMFLPILQIFGAFGIWSMYQQLKYRMKKIIILLIIVGYLVNFSYYLHHYFNHTNLLYARYWQFGYKEAVLKATSIKDIPVVFAPDIEQGYVFYLFYSQQNPSKYLEKNGSDMASDKCFGIENKYFGNCLDQFDKGYYVSSKPLPQTLNSESNEMISYPDKTTAVTLYRFTKK
ncbi:MAG: glycosyltransferase family 39 protein [Candidatus Levybacteria bacterium]|nr:glycosyltransferase family 39 protein [Candidatus Levybacteria bacterium]